MLFDNYEGLGIMCPEHQCTHKRQVTWIKCTQHSVLNCNLSRSTECLYIQILQRATNHSISISMSLSINLYTKQHPPFRTKRELAMWTFSHLLGTNVTLPGFAWHLHSLTSSQFAGHLLVGLLFVFMFQFNMMNAKDIIKINSWRRNTYIQLFESCNLLTADCVILGIYGFIKIQISHKMCINLGHLCRNIMQLTAFQWWH